MGSFKPNAFMPTILTHAAIPLALGLGLGIRTIPKPLLLAGVVACILPDLDVVAFQLHIPYADDFGHRGFTHSIAFAVALGLLALAYAQRLRCSRAVAFSFIALSTVSHALLDMITNGGLGVALWWPWSSERLFAAWQVIEVSPLSLRHILSARGWAVLQSELLWVWLPALVVAATLFGLRMLGLKRVVK